MQVTIEFIDVYFIKHIFETYKKPDDYSAKSLDINRETDASIQKNYCLKNGLKGRYGSLEAFKTDIYQHESLDGFYYKVVTILLLICRDGQCYCFRKT